MDNAEAEELGELRRKIRAASLEQLTDLIATSLDNLIDIVRKTAGSNLGTEVAAALAAELHRRNQPRLVWAPTVGNA